MKTERTIMRHWFDRQAEGIEQIGSVMFDRRSSPAYIIRYTSDLVCADYPVLMDKMARELATVTHCGLIHDLGLVDAPMLSTTRSLLIAQTQRYEWLFNDKVVALAVVTRVPELQGGVTAIRWLYEPPYPVRCFETIQPAEAWVREALQANGTKSRGQSHGPSTLAM